MFEFITSPEEFNKIAKGIRKENSTVEFFYENDSIATFHTFNKNTKSLDEGFNFLNIERLKRDFQEGFKWEINQLEKGLFETTVIQSDKNPEVEIKKDIFKLQFKDKATLQIVIKTPIETTDE